jgi:hypothetical protein
VRRGDAATIARPRPDPTRRLGAAVEAVEDALPLGLGMPGPASSTRERHASPSRRTATSTREPGGE